MINAKEEDVQTLGLVEDSFEYLVYRLDNPCCAFLSSIDAQDYVFARVLFILSSGKVSFFDLDFSRQRCCNMIFQHALNRAILLAEEFDLTCV